MRAATNYSLLQEKAFFNLRYQIQREIPVLNVANGQLPLIFQHIKTGSEVILKQFLQNGKVIISVYFMGFKLGELPQDVSNLILSEVEFGRVYTAKVSRTTKRRFLPPSQVFVNILSPQEVL